MCPLGAIEHRTLVLQFKELLKQAEQALQANLASINGVSIQDPDEVLNQEELCQRAHAELLRQAACAKDLLDATDMPTVDGVQSEAATEPAPERMVELVKLGTLANKIAFDRAGQAIDLGESRP
jgi:hypothetical protein